MLVRLLPVEVGWPSASCPLLRATPENGLCGRNASEMSTSLQGFHGELEPSRGGPC